MSVTLPLKKLSRDEKLRLMEAIWTDLSQDEDHFDSPGWHKDALSEAEKLVKSGKAKFSDWEKAKRRIRRKAQQRA
ncbi:MAG TPA: addiction module protein [Verrucomicrobiae bacterium]|nr:addiction module protein [Verrucomicrobiae bacterium]